LGSSGSPDRTWIAGGNPTPNSKHGGGAAAWNLGLGHRPLHHPSGGPPPHGYAAGRIKNVPFRPIPVIPRSRRFRPRRASRAHEMGAGIAANPHYPVSSRSLPACLHPGPPLSRSAARKTTLAARSGTIRRWFGRPPFGGRPHLESPSSSLLASAEAVAVQAMDCISYPGRVRLNSWESRRSVTRYRSTSSSIRPVLLRRVLQPAFLSRRSVVSVVRCLEADMTRPGRQQKLQRNARDCAVDCG